MKFQIALLVGLACSALAAPVIDPQVFKALEEKQSATVIVSFKNSNTAAVRNSFSSLKTTLSTRSARLNVLYNLLKDHADTTQANVRSFLESQKATKSIRISQSWMTNELIIRGIDKETIVALSNMADVKEIKADKIVAWINPTEVKAVPEGAIVNAQWGVDKVNAPAVHALGNEGEGVVVATIDTGVRGTHEALRNNFRAENGWFDPALETKTPTDYNGHGTHTMGTIVGQTNGIGVAPKAQWISCVGCSFIGCYLSDLFDCGNYIGCPTDVDGNNPRCDLAPNLVSNGWDVGEGNTFYDSFIATWRLADIAPFFPIGDTSGAAACWSANSPGDSELAIAVGSTTANESLSDFSRLGPTRMDFRIKPEIVAPGSNIISAYNSGVAAYGSMSATTAATSHVAGISALLYAQNPKLTVDELLAGLVAGAQKTIEPTGINCGNVREDDYPNNHVGAGRAEALASIQASM